MRQNRKFILFGGAALFLLLGGCDKFSSVKHFVIDSGVRSYFQYKTGSNWEYVLQTDTNVKVTTTVLNYKEGKMQWDAFSQEFFEYDLSSPIDSLVKLRAIADDNNVTRINLLYRDTTFKVAMQWYYVGGIYTAVSGTNDTLNMLGTRNVNGKNYDEVMEYAPAKKSLYRKLWIARNVGIVRKEMKDGRVFLLRSYSLQ